MPGPQAGSVSALKDQPTSQVPVILALVMLEQKRWGSQFGQKEGVEIRIYRAHQREWSAASISLGVRPMGALQRTQAQTHGV